MTRPIPRITQAAAAILFLLALSRGGFAATAEAPTEFCGKFKLVIEVIETRFVQGADANFWDSPRGDLLYATGRLDRNSGTWRGNRTLVIDAASKSSPHYLRQYVIVQAGSYARVNVAHDIAPEGWFYRLNRKRGIGAPLEGIRSLVTGFLVRTDLTPSKRLEFTITPRIDFETLRRESTLTYGESKMKVSANLGESLALARNLGRMDSLIYNIFGGSTFAQNGTELIVLLTPEMECR